MEDLGLSPKSVDNIIQKKEWVNIYRRNLDYHYEHFNEEKFPENRFKNDIIPELKRAFNEENPEIIDNRIRNTIQKWALLSSHKIYFLLRLRRLIPKEIDDLQTIKDFYKDIPLGPIDNEKFDAMTPETRTKWHDGNAMILYKTDCVNNLLGVLLSEQFFTLEPMCRIIAMGNCLFFAVKSYSPDIAIQHNEIYNTLKSVGNQGKQKEICKICPIKEKCIKLDIYSELASIYSLFYHFRIIKDYKLDLFFNEEFQKFLISDYLPKSYDIMVKAELVMEKILKNYMINPTPMDPFSKYIDQIIEMNFEGIE